jgi:Uma2 family endonuclease
MSNESNATGSGLVFYRLSVRQFEQMIDAGIIPERAHVELLGGMLVDKLTNDDPHEFVVDQLGDILRRVLPDGWIVREGKSLELGHLWRPVPDLAVVRGPRDRYRTRTPRADDVALLIEVSAASYSKDRGVKWRRYAAAGIPAYWIVHLAKLKIEVYGDPSGRGRSAGYRDSLLHGWGAEVPVKIEGREVGRIAVRAIAPW